MSIESLLPPNPEYEDNLTDLVESERLHAASEINAAIDNMTERLLSKYSKTERMGWDQKLSEAKRILKYSGRIEEVLDDCPLLSLLVQSGGVSTEQIVDVANSIVSKSSEFDKMVVQSEALRSGAAADLAKCATVDSVSIVKSSYLHSLN